MTTYLIKVILCSGALYALYILLFRNEKMMLFNRFYLLSALIIPFIIPLISISTVVRSQAPITQGNFITTEESIQMVQSAESAFNGALLFSILYITVSTLFLLRFVQNLVNIRRLIHSNEFLLRNGIRIVLLNEPAPPFSFLNNIFLNKAEYESGKIEPEVMIHEMAHVHQKHSWDILFIELLQILLWVNPFTFLYKKSVKVNHELLADDVVIHLQRDVRRYQNTILQRVVGKPPLGIFSSFNFLNIKKRLIMLQKQKNFRQSLFKSMLIIPVLIGLIIVFHQKVYAVISETAEEIGTGTIAPDTTDTLLQQYERLLDKYELKGTSLKDFVKKRSMVTRDDMEKMISIFLLLTPEERAQNRVIFIKNLPPFQKNNISSADLKKWTNGKIYGVWINEKRIPNSSLSSYKSGDFSHVFVSKLSPNAVNYGKHYYQVDLMTNEYYEKYYKDARAKEGKYFMVIGFKKPVTEK